ncbi:MAG: hypothetical protein QOJ07_3029 [Thermoleophilaceae bacterium]|nr:hypothetical protein [Thermoleophilaceae bacterium]
MTTPRFDRSNSRERRLAQNENRARTLNETLEDSLMAAPAGPERLAFTCECADADCRALVKISRAAYRAVREDARHFLVAPGHELAEIERPIMRSADYVVVQKDDRLVPIVEGGSDSRAA